MLFFCNQVRSDIRFNSFAINITDFMQNMEKSLQLLDDRKRLPSWKREPLLNGYVKCVISLIGVAMLSNSYNINLIADLLNASVQILTAIDKNFSDFEGYNNLQKSISTLLTVGGLFDFFDVNSLKRSTIKWPTAENDLVQLKKFNESMYERTNRSKKDASSPNGLLDLICYNFSLLNMDIQFNRSINDMFKNIQSAEHLIGKFTNLNKVFFLFWLL